jgi:hypothetical protein
MLVFPFRQVPSFPIYELIIIFFHFYSPPIVHSSQKNINQQEVLAAFWVAVPVETAA